jgi:hypothetical protein
VYNETNREISLSLSKDDKTYIVYLLKANEYLFYSGNPSDYSFLKLSERHNGNNINNTIYKLEKAKGYKVSYSNVNLKYEISSDNRMTIEDIKEY